MASLAVENCASEFARRQTAKAAQNDLCVVCEGGIFDRPFAHRLPWLRRCRNCGLRFADPQPSDAELAAIYDDQYYRAFGHGTGDAYGRLKQARAEALLLAAERHFPAGRLLDFGSATGELLAAAQRRGWQAQGVEPNPFAVAESQRVAPGATVYATLDDVPDDDGPFDLVTCTDVLEHLRRPDAALADFRRRLRPGGGLVVATIDVASLPARLLGPRWVHYHRDHLWYFNRLALVRLARAAGLEVLACRRARKRFTLNYILEILAHGTNWPFARCAAASALRRLPRPLLRATFPLREGLQLIARRPR